jgi:hypothetical protein
MDLLETGLDGVDWIGLAQDRYGWRALVNVVITFRLPQHAGKPSRAAQMVASRVALSFAELVS